MREIVLHDTRSGEVRRCARATPGALASMRAARPSTAASTSATHVRSSSSHLLARFLSHEGYDVDARRQRDRRQRQDLRRRRARRPSERGAGCGDDRPLHGRTPTRWGLGAPITSRWRRRRSGRIVEYIATLIEHGHAYAADGDVYFRVRSDADYGTPVAPPLDDMDQGEGVEGAERKQRSARLRAVEGAQAGRGHRLGRRRGDRAGPAGTSSARRWPRSSSGVGFDIHGGGSDLVFPHHENEAAQTRAARGEELAQLWMHNGMIQSTGEKMAKSVGNIALLHEVIERYGRDAVVMYLASGHYRQPLAFSSAELDEADAQGSSHPRRAQTAGRGRAQSAGHGSAPATRSSMRWPTTSTRPRRSRRCPSGCARPTGVGAGVGRRRSAGDAGRAGAGELTPLESVGDVASIDPEAVILLEQREQARAAARLPDGRSPARCSSRAQGWEVRDGPDGPELIPAGDS